MTNKWEWIGVTVINDPRSKKKAELQATALLDRVTFSQSYGEIVSVIEDSETVRATFQQLLLGERNPSDGLILGYSETAIALSLSSLTLTQQTGKAYCQAYFRSRGFSKNVRETHVKACQSFSELGPRFHTTISEYSVSEKAQLLASLTIHSGADLLCLDDYIVWTTSPFFVKVMARLKELKEEGASIWLFTDQLTKVGAYCDRVMWLQFGRLREVGHPSEVQERYEAYLASLHQMSLEEQQAYWAHGLASQRREIERESLIEDPKKEAVIDVPVSEPLPTNEDLPEEEEEGESSTITTPLESPSRVKRYSEGKTRSSGLVKLGRRASVALLMLGVSVGGGYLAVRHYLDTDTHSSTLEAGPLLSSFSEEKSRSTTPAFSEMSRQSESGGEALDTSTTASSQKPEVASFTHSVQVGESLSDLAIRYDVNVSELMAVNGLRDETIMAGENLALPLAAKKGTTTPSSSTIEEKTSAPSPEVPDSSTSTVYTVVQGDTLFQIARRHGKSVLEFQQVNGLQTPDLSLGQQLIIPN